MNQVQIGSLSVNVMTLVLALLGALLVLLFGAALVYLILQARTRADCLGSVITISLPSQQEQARARSTQPLSASARPQRAVSTPRCSAASLGLVE